MENQKAPLPQFMTVYRLIKSGDLRAVQVGKSYRINEDDINNFLASRYNQTG